MSPCHLAHWVFADDDCSFALRGSGARMLFAVRWSVRSPSWMVDARLCADTARTALPHSVDLVLVRFFPGTYHCCHQFFAIGAKRLRCAEMLCTPQHRCSCSCQVCLPIRSTTFEDSAHRFLLRNKQILVVSRFKTLLGDGTTAHHSVRLVRAMVLDVVSITCGSFSSTSNGIASPTCALVSCTKVVTRWTRCDRALRSMLT